MPEFIPYRIYKGVPLPPPSRSWGRDPVVSHLTVTLEKLEPTDMFIIPSHGGIDKSLYTRAVVWAANRHLDWRFATRRYAGGTGIWRTA